MNNYTIPCTEEQTKKALELGAPLLRLYGTGCSDYIDMLIISDTEAYTIPTAEEMIGWLENTIFDEINIQKFCYHWEYIICFTDNEDLMLNSGHYNSRKEATIAAIDAALEYLSNKNKNEK